VYYYLFFKLDKVLSILNGIRYVKGFPAMDSLLFDSEHISIEKHGLFLYSGGLGTRPNCQLK